MRGDGARAGVVSLGDNQIAAVLGSLNLGEVKIAQNAMPKLVTDDAKTFANHMVEGHTSAQEEATRIASEQNIAPMPNAVSQAIDAAGAQLITELSAKGNGLDQPYMESQAKMHREALVLLDCVLVPQLKNAQLKEFVTGKVRPTVQSHFDTARGTAPNAAKTGKIDCDNTCATDDRGGELPSGLRAAVCQP